MSQYDFPTPPNTQGSNPPEASPETTPNPPAGRSVLSINQKILFGTLGLVLGMLGGAILLTLFIRLMIWLINGIIGQQTVSDDAILSLRLIGLIVGLFVGGLAGFGFAIGIASTPDRWNRLNPFTSDRMRIARQAVWSLVAFCIGTLPGGILASLFVTLLFLVLNTSPNQDLSENSDWVRLRTIFVLIGMVIGGIAAVAVSLPFSQEEEQAKATEGTEGSAQATSKKSSGETSLTRSLLQSAKYAVFLMTNTARLVMPSPIVSTQRDDSYISETSKTFEKLLNNKNTEAQQPDIKDNYVIDLNDTQREIILKNWLPQIEWTNGRANTERDANELISWWQLVIGALIPFVATVPTPIFGIAGSTVVAVLGIFVTILTGLIRFRRPEERWKHYRRLTEDYQRELWNFISLNDPDYRDLDHKTAFPKFNEKMTILRQNDVRVFLGEVAVSTQNQSLVKPETQTGASQP